MAEQKEFMTPEEWLARINRAYDPRAITREVKEVEREDYEVIPMALKKTSKTRKVAKKPRKTAKKVSKKRASKRSPVAKAIAAASAAKVKRIQAEFAERAKRLQAECVLTIDRCKKTTRAALKVVKAKRR